MCHTFLIQVWALKNRMAKAIFKKPNCSLRKIIPYKTYVSSPYEQQLHLYTTTVPSNAAYKSQLTATMREASVRTKPIGGQHQSAGQLCVVSQFDTRWGLSSLLLTLFTAIYEKALFHKQKMYYCQNMNKDCIISWSIVINRYFSDLFSKYYVLV